MCIGKKRKKHGVPKSDFYSSVVMIRAYIGIHVTQIQCTSGDEFKIYTFIGSF